MEQWRPIPNFEGYYEVSDLGRVRGLDRITSTPQGPARRRGMILRLMVNKGYEGVTLRRDGKGVYRQVHVLVAAAFLGPRPLGAFVCHRDGDPRNNRLSNLCYGTPAENSADARRHGTMAMGERAARAKLTSGQVLEIRSLAGLERQADIAARFGVSQAQVSRIHRGCKWGHIVRGT